MSCQFCEQIKPEDVYYQTDYWNVVLSWDQTYLGRSVIFLKRHCCDLAEISSKELEDFFELLKSFERSLRKSFDARMFNWACLMNDAYSEEKPAPHVHWHFRPRYDHTVKVAGEVFEDLEFGHHYDRSKKREISEEVKQVVIERIKNNL